MEISFIHMQILVHLHVNKTNFHTKGFALGLALKQRQKATRKSPTGCTVGGTEECEGGLNDQQSINSCLRV